MYYLDPIDLYCTKNITSCYWSPLRGWDVQRVALSAPKQIAMFRKDIVSSEFREF